MSGLGKGRYTTYVGESTKHKLLWKLFNTRAENGKFYGDDKEPTQKEAAKAVLERALGGDGLNPPLNKHQLGDPSMFPNGVDLSFGDAPDLLDVKWMKAGDPANPFVPDISSPGPNKTEGTDKANDPLILATDIKANYSVPTLGQGTVSPSVTSTDIGTAVLRRQLKLGKSSV